MRSLKVHTTWMSILLSLFSIHTVSAAIIYSDDFSGDGSASLIGTAPDTTQVSEVWQGIGTGAQWTTDGKMTNTAAQSRFAYLDFTPESGNVYTIQVEVSHINLQRAFHFGFMTGVPAEGQAFTSADLATPWMRLQGNRDTYAMITKTGSPAGATMGSGYVAQVNTLQIVLDTTESAWSVEWLLNGTSLATHTYSSNPAIIGVGFGRLLEGTYDVDSFELSDSSEPPAGPTSILYSDDFSGDGLSSLIGTTLDTTQGGEVWQGIETNAQWTTDGKIAVGDSQSRFAYLDFTPESGNVYTLAMDVSHIATARAFHFGFMTGIPAEGQAFTSVDLATPWMRLQGNGATYAMITKTGSPAGATIGSGYVAQVNTLQIVLDTTESSWSAEWFLNGASLATHIYSSNPAIIGVGFGRLLEGTYDVDSFELSVVSEPITTASVEILSLAPVSDTVLEMVVSCDYPAICYPKMAVALSTSTVWSGVAHSTNGLAPFVVTNLNYSALSGTDYLIYVESDESAKFFMIGAE